MSADERVIIEACQRGDTARFALLYDAYARPLYDFIYYKTHHKETAQDIASEVFLRALSKIGQFDPERSFKSWLYRIAQNAVIDHYRRLRPTVDIDDIWDLASEEDIMRDADTKLLVRELQTHLARLPQIQRDILILRLWQGLSYKEIAEIVGKSEANSKMIYSRALRDLRAQMPGALLLLLLCNTQLFA